MKLGTVRNGTRDGALVVISKDGATYTSAADIAPTLQDALDRWDEVEAALQARSAALHAGDVEAKAYDGDDFHAPLPRAYEWIDGSAYINHIVLVRKARGLSLIHI